MISLVITAVVLTLGLGYYLMPKGPRRTKQPKKMKRVLFIIKRQLGYNGSPVPSKGLFNSALFVVNALRLDGYEAVLVEVVDGNDIDREVTKHRPSHCILEALWATPAKVAELSRLHTGVHFIVRIHSKTPFLATEGVAIEWLRSYDVPIACNARAPMKDLKGLLKHEPVYLPNIYHPTTPFQQKRLEGKSPNLFVGCLGAIRPLKNQLLQAVAAIHYAERTKRTLVFHINTRVEQGGEQVLKNIRALFANGKHRLVQHGWCDSHEQVLAIVKSLDISMQVSYTETFNIVSADAVWRGVPIVVSHEVEWARPEVKADPNSLQSMIEAMQHTERAGEQGTKLNHTTLWAQNKTALRAWKYFLEEYL